MLACDRHTQIDLERVFRSHLSNSVSLRVDREVMDGESGQCAYCDNAAAWRIQVIDVQYIIDRR